MQRGVSLALAAVLTFESLFNSGVSLAFADPLDGEATTGISSTQVLQSEDDTILTSENVTGTPSLTAVETWDWTGRTDNLTLSSAGLTLDADDLAAAVAEAQDAEKDLSAGALRALLPEALLGTLDLELSLDPAASDASADGHTVVLPGDTLTVSLPEGLTLSDAALDVYHSDAEGSPTAIKVAEAAPAQDGTALTLTFVEPADAETGAAYYVGTPAEGTVPAAQTEGKQQLKTLDANLSLEVSVSTALLSDEASELTWTLQTSSADGAVKQDATLALPGLSELAAQLGAEAQGAEKDAESPAPAEDEPAPAPQAELTCAPVGDSTTKATLTMSWFDNNNSGKVRPTTEDVEKTLSLSFTLDDSGDPLPLTAENAEKYFGMTPEDLAGLFSVKATGVGAYTATASNLYSQIKDSNGDTHSVTWTLTSSVEPEGYYRADADDGGLNFQLLGTSTYKIVAKVGEETLDPAAAPAADLVVIDGSGKAVSLDSVNNHPGWKGAWDAESGTYTLTAPVFGTDNLPIEYGLTDSPETPLPTPDDGYAFTYDNAASTNHGSNTEAVYDGGTVTILRVGKATFNATKQWLDASNKQGLRPSGGDTITFTLWRYASNGDTAANAAQVTDANGNFVTLTAKVDDVTKDNAIDLGALLADQYPELTLEKYDNDGYAYYYGIREESIFAGYETVYGSVSADGEVTDTAPNYTNKDGKLVSKDGWERDTNVDRLIYNNGSIGNRLSGQKTVEGEKEWHVAAFADQLNGVSCTFTLQSRVKGDENAEWTNTTVTKTLTDFTAETLTKDFSGTYDLYDLNGNELEYRWIETGVEQKYSNISHGGTGFTQPEEGEGGHLFSTFTLFLRVLDEGGSDLGDADEYEQVEFTSETWVDENGVSRARNTFDDTVDETVSKRWAAPNEDGELVDLDPGDVPAHNLTISIYDGDVKVSEAVMDGTVDADTTPVTLVDGIDEDIKADFEQANPTYQETTPDHLEINNLPRYKSDGSRYNYRIVEGTKLTEWNAQTYYDPDTHKTSIVNMPADGAGANVALEKDWVDGGDSSHRLAVEVEFYAKEAISKDGKTVYEKGDILPILILGEDGNLKKVDSVTITEDDTWFRTAMIMGVTDADLSKVGVRETYLVSSGADGVDPASYEVLTYDEARKKYEDSEQVPSWVNTGWGYEESGFNNAHLERVSTGEHVYEVSYKSATAEESPYELPTFYVSNRRIGLVNISIEKTWKDGATKADDRPDAVYRISCDDPKAVFAVDDEGRATVKLNNGNTLPLFEEDPDLSGEAPKRLTGSVETDENGRTTLLVSVPKGTDDENTVATGICGLPKYDGNGTVVSYSVTEEWADDDHAGYASSLSEPTYTTGVWHFKDTCTYTATNSLVGSRDVVFFKEWNDAYIREGAGQRPDINLTLYRVSAAEGSTPQKVTGYISWRWEALKDDNGDVSQYQWKATAPNLATYDANGYAYTYYAVENIPDAAARLDYQDVTFKEDDLLNDWEAPEGVKLSDTALWNLADTEKPEAVDTATGDEAGSSYALREGYTFVNSLKNTLRVGGSKIWQNVPGDVGQAALPQILVLLQRRYVGDQDWPEAHIEKDGDKWVPAEGPGVVAWTSTLEGSEATYSFTIVKEGDNNDVEPGAEGALPRYDASGRRYEYRAVEVITGLIGTPALPLSDEDVEKIDFASEEGLTTADDVYAAQHGEAGSFVLRNTYAPAKGNLTVKKIVEGQREEDDKFPNVTFSLYRFDPKEGEDSAEKVDEATITSFESDDSDKTGTATHTFEDLEIYTPLGEYWHYYVVEKAVNGYTTTVGMGDLKADAVIEAGSQSPEAMEDGATLVKADDEVDFSFKNTYAEDNDLTLTGTKYWNDLGNAFKTRPDSLDITLTRHSTKQTAEEPVKLQSTNASGEAYLQWSNTDADTWTYTISNLEQWAPDGTAWTYTVTEKLADNNQAYRITTGSVEARGSDPDGEGSYSGAFGKLENRLAGTASVKKSWEGDGNDEWGLRPTSVTVELQARTSNDGTSWGEWGNASEVLTRVAGTNGGITATQTLTGPNWSHTWNVLPNQLKDGTLVQYRVVETKVGGKDVANPTGDDLDITYPLTNSYTGEGTTALSSTRNTDNNSTTSTSQTTITNTLDATSLTIKKAWDDDGNKWGLRDKVSGETDWSTTFYLQRSTDGGGTWEYVTKADGTRVKSVTVTGAAGTNEGIKTFGNLPAFDENGKPYRYRAVEVVPGGYSLDGAIVDGLDKGHAAVTGDSSASNGSGDADQTFTNTLQTITLSGKKEWNTFGATGLVPGDANNDGTPDKTPTLALERTTAENPAAEDATWENVTKIAGQPAWTWGKDSWKWTYDGSAKASDLPKYDGDGKAYTYRVSEAAGSVPGFYPTYEGGGTTTGPATADPDTGNQAASTITNVATRFSLNKVSDSNNGENVDDVELSVMSADKATVYAVWNRDPKGMETSFVWPDGVPATDVWAGGITSGSADTSGSVEMTGASAGDIIGLKAGSYKVVETGDLPQDYARAADVSLTIAADGSINGVTSSAGTVAEIKVTDEVFRGYFQFTKQLTSGDGLEGVTFDLYRAGTGVDGADELMAEGLTTGADGTFASKSSDVAFEDGASLGTADDSRGKLSDGLQPGSYYLLERSTTADAALPSGEGAVFPFTLDQETDHEAVVTVKDNAEDNPGDVLLNTPFQATVSLTKSDATDGAPIDDAVFELQCLDGSTWVSVAGGLETGNAYTLTLDAENGYQATGADSATPANAGELRLTLNLKGTYRLVETANQGYEVPKDAAALAVTFELKDVDHGTVVTLDLENERLTGKATLTKTDDEGDELEGATFSLQTKGADGEWADVEGKTGLTTDGNGQIAVDGLAWGTYRFDETTPTEGYVGHVGDKPVTSAEFTIDRDTVSTEQAVAAQNAPTKLKIKKVAQDGTVLESLATFTIRGRLAGGETSVDVTTVNGVATLDDALLVAGETYTLTEKTAPAGYELAGSVTFTVDKNGDVVSLGTTTDGSGSYAVGKDGGINLITAVDTKIDVTFQKDGDATLDGVTNPYARAEFTITPAEGDAFADGKSDSLTKKTDANGSFGLTGLLVAGSTYTVTESKAPAGYELIDGNLVFEVNADGSLKVTNQPTGYDVSAEDGLVTIKATDPSIKVTLAKVDEDGKALSGAKFTVAPKAGTNTTFANGSTDSIQVTVDESTGKVSLDDALLVAGGTYTLTETVAPNGHEVAGWVDFTVGTDGTVTLVDPDETTAGVAEGTDGTGKYVAAEDANGTVTITATDLQTEVTFLKVSTKGGTALPGAEFTLTPEQGKGFASTSVDLNGDGQNDIQNGVLHVVSDGQGQVVLVGLLNVDTDYTLTETVAPAGYELNTTVFEFTVNADGTITAALDQEGYSFDGTDVITVTATDAPIEVTLNKADLAENALNGAVFSLSGTFANENGTPGSSATRELTLEDNTITIDGLIATREGAEYVYKLTETTAPKGYELLGEFRFTVDEHGAIHAVSDERAEGAAGYDVSDDGLTITAHDQDIQINLSKQDTEGNALSGAAFELVPAEGSHFADGSTSVVSATPGRPVTGLVAGQTYVLTETDAPAGYEAISGSFTFTVNADGTIAAASAENDPAFAVADDGITIVATDAAIEVGLIKLSTDGTQLEGASFSLAAADDPDTELATITSTAEGTVAVPDLVAGKTYVLTEVEAPLGYELAEGSFTFTVGADGTISVPEDAENGAAYSHANRGVVTVTVTDEPVEVQIEKLGENSAPLTGATFSLAPAEGSTFANGGTEALTLSTTDGLTSVVSAQLVAGQTYVLTETAAPAGYELIAGSFTFTVNADGTLAPAAEGNAPAYALGVDAGVITITATDEPVSIELSKTDLSGNALEDAEFTLTGIFANADGTPAAEAETRTVPVDGTTSVSGLIASVEGGTVYEYQLVETVAPAGFELIDGTLAFTVDAQGNLVVDPATVPAGYVAESGTVTVTAQDTPVEIVVAKQSESGEALEGAEFTLSGTFADGTAEKDVTPGTPVTGLIAGEKYVLTETVAPEGYELLNAPVTLLVFEDGSLALAENTPADLRDAVSVDNGDGTAIVVVRDTPEPTIPDTGDEPDPGDEPEPDKPTVPDTGDHTMTALPAILGAGGAALIGIGLLARRKRKQ
ncbi:SpaA isopeptide-forming pilin-related protein [Thermophilibacter provencensis]|uniref:SpaA isopeptide-forming pilin-related protein n=1 Tax=Thermophilibacter provencensis TaxID=1852386 RepID=A0ABT7V2F5_9ACTN|nr:SpaA isopeptide-forming pilin-related protein [Thermophilibacter provencensis]MDM8270787.1 SpaA isopeptide-forming pilin-related protein [Thermophilibacter provencensis]